MKASMTKLIAENYCEDLHIYRRYDVCEVINGQEYAIEHIYFPYEESMNFKRKYYKKWCYLTIYAKSTDTLGDFLDFGE